MKDMLRVNGGCETPGKIINIRQLQILIHSCTKFPSAWTKEIDFRTWVLFLFFSFSSALPQSWLVWLNLFFKFGPTSLFVRQKNREINTSVRKRYNLLADNSHVQETFVWRRVFTTWTVICKICDIFNYSWKRKRTWNFFTNCDWKKFFQ